MVQIVDSSDVVVILVLLGSVVMLEEDGLMVAVVVGDNLSEFGLLEVVGKGTKLNEDDDYVVAVVE